MKNRIIIFLTLALAVIAIGLIINRSSSTLKSADTDFAVDDTATITRIFMADRANNSVELSRDSLAGWIVNGSYKVRKDAIEILLKTLLNVQVMEPVSLSGRNNVIRRLAGRAVKTEIYQKVYRVNIFGRLKLFPHEKRTRVYYVGSNTQDNLGTYMLMEGSELPVITYIPGFRGYISVRYSPFLADWRDHTIFDKSLDQIAAVQVEFTEVPGFSYKVEKAGEQAFTLTALSGNKRIDDYDTTVLLDFLTSFSKIRFEALLNTLRPEFIDSVTRSQPFHIISLTDRDGKETVVRTFHKANPGGPYDDNGNFILYDRDRLYAEVNDGKDFVLIQFYVFDNILRPLPAFLKN